MSRSQQLDGLRPLRQRTLHLARLLGRRLTVPVLLVVEDEVLILMSLQEDLSAAGFEVVTASSGNEAMAKLDNSVKSFRAVITDIRLGHGPDGWAVAKHARELVPDMPIIYATGDSAWDWPSMGVPKSLLITKPYAAPQIITAVTQLMTDVDAQRAATSGPPDGATD
jgi:DNA-binding NtrC family response regulator